MMHSLQGARNDLSPVTALVVIPPRNGIPHHETLPDVRFSNRPSGVKHFQTVHHCNVDVTLMERGAPLRWTDEDVHAVVEGYCVGTLPIT
jgi:hypothetical protein